MGYIKAQPELAKWIMETAGVAYLAYGNIYTSPSPPDP
jgi:hypothetical protein